MFSVLCKFLLPFDFYSHLLLLSENLLQSFNQSNSTTIINSINMKPEPTIKNHSKEKPAPSSPIRPIKFKKKKREPSSNTQPSKIIFETTPEDWQFEKLRSAKLDLFEKELEKIEKSQQEVKFYTDKTLNDCDCWDLIMRKHTKSIEDIPEYLRKIALTFDEAEEACHKEHVHEIREITDRSDRIKDQCRDIRDLVKQQKEELNKYREVNASRSIYIIVAFIFDCLISGFLSLVWFFESISGIEASPKLYEMRKWPISMVSLRLKTPIYIPSTVAASPSTSNSNKKRRH